jgi:hypothetical protein
MALFVPQRRAGVALAEEVMAFARKAVLVPFSVLAAGGGNPPIEFEMLFTWWTPRCDKGEAMRPSTCCLLFFASYFPGSAESFLADFS